MPTTFRGRDSSARTSNPLSVRSGREDQRAPQGGEQGADRRRGHWRPSWRWMATRLFRFLARKFPRTISALSQSGSLTLAKETTSTCAKILDPVGVLLLPLQPSLGGCTGPGTSCSVFSRSKLLLENKAALLACPPAPTPAVPCLGHRHRFWALCPQARHGSLLLAHT